MSTAAAAAAAQEYAAAAMASSSGMLSTDHWAQTLNGGVTGNYPQYAYNPAINMYNNSHVYSGAFSSNVAAQIGSIGGTSFI